MQHLSSGLVLQILFFNTEVKHKKKYKKKRCRSKAAGYVGLLLTLHTYVQYKIRRKWRG